MSILNRGAYTMAASNVGYIINKAKRILKDMRHILDKYRMVYIANKTCELLEKDKPSEWIDTGAEMWYPSATDIKNNFVIKYRKRKPWNSRYTKRYITELLQDCVNDGYVQAHASEVNDRTVDLIQIKKSGRELIDTIPGLPFIKIGLYELWWDKHGIFISGFVMGVALQIVLFIGNRLWSIIEPWIH